MYIYLIQVDIGGSAPRIVVLTLTHRYDAVRGHRTGSNSSDVYARDHETYWYAGGTWYERMYIA